jgi:hypothetical protein
MPGERPSETQERAEGGASPDKHSRARRRLLKALAAGGGAVAATQVVPARWVKPIVDTVVVPAHAQASGPSMLVQLSVRDDGAPETFNASGVADSALLAADNDLLVDGQATLINPPVPGQTVTLTLALAGGTDGDIDSLNPLVVPSDAGTGVATFGDISVQQDDTAGDPPQDLFAGFTATFSSPGFPNQIITITFA